MFDQSSPETREIRKTRPPEGSSSSALSDLMATLECTADGILVTDGAGRIDRFNQKFLKLWNIPKEVVSAGREIPTLEIAISQLEDPQGFLERVRCLYGSTEDAYDLIHFKDGRVYERYSQARIEHGQISGRVWSFRDVTESRRLAEERDRLLIEEQMARAAAEASQRRAALLAEASMLLSSSLDFHATLRAVGQLALPSMADWCIIDLLRRDSTFRRTVVHHDPYAVAAAHELETYCPELSAEEGIGECICSGRIRTFSGVRIQGERLVSEDGRTVKLLCSGHARAMQELGVRSWMTIPLKVHGRILGALSFVSSTDARRYGTREIELGEELGWRVAVAVDHALLYEKAQQAIRSREDLLAIVSHDLKNPLSAIYMNARLIQGAAQGAVRGKDVSVESIRRQALIIQQSAERMNRLIRDLLDQAKIETGHFALDRRKVDFAGIVHETLEMLSALAAQKEIALNSNEVPSGIEVPCDRERVAQVLSNLIGNAIKFTPIGGQIDVSAEHSASAIRVAIRDTGSGIDPLHVPHIFDRYWQPEHNATKGTGLGLAIAKGIVEAHGGKIWVESRPHFGSTFYFTLPLEVDALTA